MTIEEKSGSGSSRCSLDPPLFNSPRYILIMRKIFVKSLSKSVQGKGSEEIRAQNFKHFILAPASRKILNLS